MTKLTRAEKQHLSRKRAEQMREESESLDTTRAESRRAGRERDYSRFPLISGGLGKPMDVAEWLKGMMREREAAISATKVAEKE